MISTMHDNTLIALHWIGTWQMVTVLFFNEIFKISKHYDDLC